MATTKTGLIEAVAKQEGITKAMAERIIGLIGNTIIADLLLDGRGSYPDLGNFKVVIRAAAERKNPQTGESVGIKPAYKTIVFKPFKKVKEKLV